MRISRRHLAVSALLAASSRTRAFASPAAPKMEAETLPDGTRLVVLSDGDAQGVAVDVFFRVGLADEGGLSGVRSLLARSWISEAKFRSTPLLFSDIRRFGGGAGTDCGDDWVEIWSVGPSDEASVRTQMQTILTNLVAAPVFSPQTVLSARRDQERAILLAKDDLWVQVTNELRNRAWETSPSSRSLLGEAALVPKLGAEQLGTFYQKYFRPDRATVVVAGNITAEGAKNKVINSLGAGSWGEKGTRAPAQKPFVQDVIPPDLRLRVVSRRAPATLVSVGLLAPGTETSKTDWAALILMDAILGAGKASRLFALRENFGIAYDLRTRLIAGRAQSLWAVYVIGDAPVPETLGLVTGEIEAWANNAKPATEAELRRAKVLLQTRHLSERQRLRDRAWGLGWAETMGLGAEWEMQFEARMEAVTLDDVNRVARRVLGGNRAVVHSLGPKA